MPASVAFWVLSYPRDIGGSSSIVENYRQLTKIRLAARASMIAEALSSNSPIIVSRSSRPCPTTIARSVSAIEAWRTDNNTVRPHSSLGGMAPAEFINRPRQGHMDTEAE